MWLIETRVFPLDEEARLIATLGELGIPHIQCAGGELRTRLPQIIADQLSPDTFVRGSCWLISQLNQTADWRRDLWGTTEDFAYSRYAPRYQEVLLNAPFEQVTFHELCWTREEIFPECGEGIFVRPDDGFKSIEGQYVRFNDFDRWIEKCQLLQVRGAAPLIVARPQQILAEWRCMLADGELIGSSQYKPGYQSSIPESVREFVTETGRAIDPPCRVYVMDIAETPRGLHVVEIGCVCCVAFYEADTHAIIERLAQL